MLGRMMGQYLLLVYFVLERASALDLIIHDKDLGLEVVCQMYSEFGISTIQNSTREVKLLEQKEWDMFQEEFVSLIEENRDELEYINHKYSESIILVFKEQLNVNGIVGSALRTAKVGILMKSMFQYFGENSIIIFIMGKPSVVGSWSAYQDGEHFQDIYSENEK